MIQNYKKQILLPYLFYIFSLLLLFKSLFYFDYISNIPTIFDFLIPFIIVSVICYTIIVNFRFDFKKYSKSLIIPSVFGFIMGTLLILLPKLIKIEENYWFLIIEIGIILTLLIMIIINSFFYVRFTKELKWYNVFKILLVYVIAFTLIVVSSIFFGILFNPIF